MALHQRNLQRVIQLAALLKACRYPNYPRFLKHMRDTDVAGTYRLSAKTFQRDIEFLKTECHAPLAYDFKERGYCLTDSEWMLEIPQLAESALISAAIGARLAEEVFPAPLRQRIRQAVDALFAGSKMIPAETRNLLALTATCSRIAIPPEIFSTVYNAWQHHQLLDITYESANNNVSEMLFEPHVLAFHESCWYVKGKLRSKNGLAVAPEQQEVTLMVHRISRAATRDERFAVDEELLAQASRHRIFNFPVVRDVILKVTKLARYYLEEHFDTEVLDQDGDWFTVQIAEAPEYKIINYVIGEGGEAQLLNHPELMAQVVERATKVAKIHNTEKSEK